MAHTDFSTLANVAQYEDTDGLTLVVDLDSPWAVLAHLTETIDDVALATIDYARGLLSSGEDTLDSINEGNTYLWMANLSEHYVTQDA